MREWGRDGGMTNNCSFLQLHSVTHCQHRTMQTCAGMCRFWETPLAFLQTKRCGTYARARKHAHRHTHTLLVKWQKMKAASENDFPLKTPLKDPCQIWPNFPNTSLELFGVQHDYHNVHNMVWRYAGTSIFSWVFDTHFYFKHFFFFFLINNCVETMWQSCVSLSGMIKWSLSDMPVP